VRGLHLHLARLEAASLEIFGAPVGEARLRELMHQALGDRSDAWLRVSLFSRDISHRQTTAIGAPSVMVGVFDPPPPLGVALRLQVQTYEREAPHLKHAATFGLVRARRTARAAGYDDALFVTRDGLISEGSLWNIGFLRGDRVIWPQAPMLAGVTQALIDAGFAKAGLMGETHDVRLPDLADFDGAFICNSANPACGVLCIGDRTFVQAPDRLDRLRAAWASNPAQPI